MDAGSEAALSLRESFGDRRPIDISRKITACVACRKQKIKCHMPDGAIPCTRCKKRGLSCVVNRSLQMLLEGDVAWKANVEQKLHQLEDNINRLNQQARTTGGVSNTNVNTLPPLMSPRHNSTTTPVPAPQMAGTIVTTEPQPQQRQNEAGWEVVMDLNRGPGVVPASVVSELSDASPATFRQNNPDDYDLIDRGVISLVDAEAFFHLYHQRLDHFLYRILDEHDSLSSVRKSSPLLTAAICTVGALHTPSSHYQACYQNFTSLASSRMFSKRNSHDDVRALCIGAFWLSDISWTLVGTAARLAGELNLHRCIPKIPHSKKACYLRTRLYYLVYVCDHHFSVAYGRPPMTRDFSSVTPPREFLKSEFATEDDSRLVSQVEIWSISTRVFDQFSLDPEGHLSDQLTPQIRRLSIALDTWRADWQERFQYNASVGNYPRKGVGLHYHFAKLYLCSHVFRRAPSPNEEQLRFEPDMGEFANMAIHSASSIVQVIVADNEIQSYLHGLPAYFDTMIAFAFVFLLRFTIKNPANLSIDKAAILDMLYSLVKVLKDTTAIMHPRHLLTSIASSMEKLLDRFSRNNNNTNTSQEPGAMAPPQIPPGPSNFDPDGNQWLSPTEGMFIENYDFLFSPGADFNYDFDFNSLSAH
ncbi:C6 transcription factor [Exophiala viscosa]|uniref:C6 transcription factor n=1 Tax=Exophiala viscosa TaxID=2486360 RepID=A0AAN6E2G7_9EURO|nr:C6 transcription factor [Exophiala viscosa]KAI1629764.1 C6 transcription factor [Exophiala viscosa]